MSSDQVDLLPVFKTITKALQANKTELNQADTFNHNHGDHMVDIFTQIASTLQKNQGAYPSAQLQKAAENIQSIQSGSAQYYAQSLNQAAKELSGQKAITAENAMTLLQTLLGGGQASTQSSSIAPDLLGSLLGGLTGQATDPSSLTAKQGEVDWLKLAGAGLEFLQSKQAGKDNLTALMDALMPGDQAQQAPHRKQSGVIIANTLMQALGSVLTNSAK